MNRIFHDSLRILTAVLLFMTAFLALSAGVTAQESALFTPAQIQKFVAPIALYPDDLLANVLTASTIPDQVTEANKYLKSKGGTVTSMPTNDWDPSVKALLFFPQVLSKMSGDLAWTTQLGDAVISQQQDVLNAVQSFRTSAVSAGNLQSTPQMSVGTEGSTVTIDSTEPDVVYVPDYNPDTVLTGGAPLLTFGAGMAVGNWWHYQNCNWANGNIGVNPAYHSYYNYPPGARYYAPQTGFNGANMWAPSAAARTGYYNRNATQINASVNRSATVNKAGTNYPNQAAIDKYNASRTASANAAQRQTINNNMRTNGAFDSMRNGAADRACSDRGFNSNGGGYRGGGGGGNRGGGGARGGRR